MRLNKKAINKGALIIVKGYEVRLSIDGYYTIYHSITRRYYHYSNYDLMRRCLTELLNK